MRGNLHVKKDRLCQLGKDEGRDNNHSAVSMGKDQEAGARADLEQDTNSILDLGDLKYRGGIKGAGGKTVGNQKLEHIQGRDTDFRVNS